MIIGTPQDIHVQRDPCLLGPAIQPMMQHVALQLPDVVVAEVEFTVEEGPGGNVKHGSRKSLVQGGVAVSEALESVP